MRLFLLTILFLAMVNDTYSQQIDIQGHRGARGMMPENSIPAFIYAMDQGVTTLEMDVVITKDHKVVVSHDPYLMHDICYNAKGEEITKKEEKEYNIYQMTYDEVTKCDCGSKGNPRFKEQMKIKTSKPLLSDVIKAAEKHAKGVTLFEVGYNIEIKSLPEDDNIFQPTVDVFSDLVYNLIDQYLPWERVTIQSFDFRVLRYWHEKYPDVKLAVLIENPKSIKTNLKELGFTPAIYSSYHKLLNAGKVAELRQLGIKVIPWTVNELSDMKKLISWKVDGLITDYPNRARELGLISAKPDK
ncbi:MAG TPA: glycerophosphodiester phosphodiesterase family protein [Fulvivirga sp.]|nr:glycerophosphodiester phosphodiesterase family protein [Fulvivirga sp.]